MDRAMNKVVVFGALSLLLGAGPASAAISPKHNALGHRGMSRPAMAEGRAAAIGGTAISPTPTGRGADRGYSMYFSPEQDEAYKGRFP
jgi:hypothetical protein